MFQSTFPQGERHKVEGGKASLEYVSIHVPARGTTKKAIFEYVDARVSIHVPARGTTLHKCILYNLAPVSIHVPARGTTQMEIDNDIVEVMFQSTFPQGERQVVAPALRVKMAEFQSTFPQGERPGYQPS